ncbi:MAG: hypothetical protein JXA33_02210, partial [Anaerolineae bacterium]|nr:hypothetical protein [Anaerolineae bacterium]
HGRRATSHRYRRGKRVRVAVKLVGDLKANGIGYRPIGIGYRPIELAQGQGNWRRSHHAHAELDSPIKCPKPRARWLPCQRSMRWHVVMGPWPAKCFCQAKIGPVDHRK